MYTCMTKVISISDEAYNELRRLDGDKSFSEILIELVRKRNKELFLGLAGAWKSKESDLVAEELLRERKGISRRAR